MLDLRTMLFRDYSVPAAKSVPTIVDMPYAGHTAMIAHFQKGQSLIEMLLANGLNRIFLTGWKSATEDMKDLGIDEYLAEINVLVDDLGGRMNLIGLCQGGWMSAMYAARFPH
jgi:poly(3-hydroxybutyrate) depolymerase